MSATNQTWLASEYLEGVFEPEFFAHGDISNGVLKHHIWIWKNWMEVQDMINKIRKVVGNANIDKGP
jgi:hypothetical protein